MKTIEIVDYLKHPIAVNTLEYFTEQAEQYQEYVREMSKEVDTKFALHPYITYSLKVFQEMGYLDGVKVVALDWDDTKFWNVPYMEVEFPIQIHQFNRPSKIRITPTLITLCCHDRSDMSVSLVSPNSYSVDTLTVEGVQECTRHFLKIIHILFKRIDTFKP